MKTKLLCAAALFALAFGAAATEGDIDPSTGLRTQDKKLDRADALSMPSDESLLDQFLAYFFGDGAV